MTTIVIMKVPVAPGREEEFEQVVAERSALHRQAKGFERMYLLKPSQAPEYRLVTWWKEAPDPEAWVRKEAYALSEDRRRHAGLVVGPVAHEVLEVVQQY